MPFRRFSLLLLWAPLLALGGCDRADVSPLGGPSPQAESRAAQLVTPGLRLAHGRVPADTAARRATAMLGPAGGYLAVAGHMLFVPGGAVLKPTRFTMEVVEDGWVGVSLTATRTLRDGHPVDVGALGFRRPVTLAIRTDYITEAGLDAAELEVVWVLPGGALAPVKASWVDPRGYVVGVTSHFSQYGIGTPRTGDVVDGVTEEGTSSLP